MHTGAHRVPRNNFIFRPIQNLWTLQCFSIFSLQVDIDPQHLWQWDGKSNKGRFAWRGISLNSQQSRLRTASQKRFAGLCQGESKACGSVPACAGGNLCLRGRGVCWYFCCAGILSVLLWTCSSPWSLHVLPSSWEGPNSILKVVSSLKPVNRAESTLLNAFGLVAFRAIHLHTFCFHIKH